MFENEAYLHHYYRYGVSRSEFEDSFHELEQSKDLSIIF